MKVVLFGASGMVGQGVLRECLLDPGVESVVSVGRSATGRREPKLREIVRADLTQYADIEGDLADAAACFFCLGVSAGDVSAEEYERITYAIPLAAAETLARVNPAMTFVYVSGAGTDSTEQGRVRWARVKGRTENALLRMPFARAYMFRPGVIIPMHGATSKTRSYRMFYAAAGPLLPGLRRVFPNHVLTTEQIGRAMLAAARYGAPKRVLESADIRSLSPK